MTSSARVQALAPARRRRSNMLGALVAVGGLAAVTGLVACSPPGSNDDQELPPGIQDPAISKTPDGALAFYRGVVAATSRVFNEVVASTGVMTDELTGVAAPLGVSTEYTDIDSRNASQNAGPVMAAYRQLHRLRAQAREARGFLATYVPDSSALVGHLYGVEGYAVVLLADLYCSGVPLSTVNFGADYTMAAGSSTEALYHHAVALFDTALALVSDKEHVQIQRLASVGRGRAFLALGRYDSADAAVAAVPTDFRYGIVFSDENRIAVFAFQAAAAVAASPIMGDLEGSNGLDYRSSGDPRTPVAVYSTSGIYGNTIYFPAKYPDEGPTTYVLADGIEARLIEAEAALNLNSGSLAWLATLDSLRTDGTFDTQPNADNPSQTDTLWHAGTGGVPGLRPLVDPGNADARVSLLFRERAFWLYLTAHRQGDLRRLVRQYHRARSAVYPTGFFIGGSNGQYGSEVTLPVPEEEKQFNPNYTGCINRDA